MRYKICIGTAKAVEREVNNLINMGWKVSGDLQFCRFDPDKMKNIVAQAVTNELKKEVSYDDQEEYLICRSPDGTNVIEAVIGFKEAFIRRASMYLNGEQNQIYIVQKPVNA